MIRNLQPGSITLDQANTQLSRALNITPRAHVVDTIEEVADGMGLELHDLAFAIRHMEGGPQVVGDNYFLTVKLPKRRGINERAVDCIIALACLGLVSK